MRVEEFERFQTDCRFRGFERDLQFLPICGSFLLIWRAVFAAVIEFVLDPCTDTIHFSIATMTSPQTIIHSYHMTIIGGFDETRATFKTKDVHITCDNGDGSSRIEQFQTKFADKSFTLAAVIEYIVEQYSLPSHDIRKMSLCDALTEAQEFFGTMLEVFFHFFAGPSDFFPL